MLTYLWYPCCCKWWNKRDNSRVMIAVRELISIEKTTFQINTSDSDAYSCIGNLAFPAAYKL